MKQRFDDVIRELEEERQRVDEDLRRFAVDAAYVRALLPRGSSPGPTTTALHSSALPDSLMYRGLSIPEDTTKAVLA